MKKKYLGFATSFTCSMGLCNRFFPNLGPLRVHRKSHKKQAGLNQKLNVPLYVGNF